MSSIEKLSIQGIRSFGHEEEDKQVLQFFHPLTLIVGQNGAGKTTIIECLRYISSGEQPPGSKNAFVHDPKVAHEAEVKGQVKLKFKDKAGQNVVVTRNVIATQKAKRVEFKTLEGTIRRVTEFGAKSISSKCAEIDREMVESLGVSKPVLTNVIFCHQEESNWPLSEAKHLKNKFDEIFAATRYIKALDNIKKIRQEQASNIKEYQLESRYLKDDKERAAQLSSDLEKQKARLSAALESVAKITNQMKPLQESYNEMEARGEEIQGLDTKIAQKKAEKKEMESSYKEIEDNLENVFQGSIGELKRMYANHQKEVVSKKERLEESEGKADSLQRNMNHMSDEKARLLMSQGKLEQEAESHKQTLQRRDVRVKEIAQEMNIPGYSSTTELPSRRLKEFRDLVHQKTSGLEREGKQLKREFEEKQQSVEKQMQELRNTKSRLEQSVDTKSKQMNDNKKEVCGIKQELNKMADNAQKLRDMEEDMEEDLQKAETELKHEEKSVDVDQLKAEIEKHQTDKKQGDAKMSTLSNEMSTISLQSKARTQLEMLQKEKKSKEDQIRRIRGRNEEEMTHLLGHFPSEDARNKLQDFLDSKVKEVEQCREQLQRAKMELSGKETNQKNILDQLKSKENELRNIEEKLMLECGSQNVDQGLQSLKQSISNLQSEKGALTGSTHLYERYIKSLQRAEAQCPLCHRGFDAQREAEELVQELKDKLRLAPAKMKEKDKALIQQREKMDRLQKLSPLKDKMTQLADREIPDLKTRLASVTEKIGKLKNKIEEDEETLSMLQSDETLASNIKPDVMMLDQYLGELKTLERKIGTQTQQLSGGGEGIRTIQEVNKERGDLQVQLATINRNLEHKQRQRDNHLETIQMLRVSVNSITTEKLRLSAQLQQREKLESRQAELTSSSQTFQREIESSKEEIKPIETKIKKLSEEKSEIVQRKEDTLQEKKNEINNINQKLEDVDRLSAEINKYISAGKAELLREGQAKIQSLEQKMTKIDDESRRLREIIDQLNGDIVGQEVKERELSDNIQLQVKKQKINEVAARLRELEEQRGEFDSIALRTEKHRLNKEITRLFKEKNQADGKQSVLKEEVRKTERELDTEKFRTAEEKYGDIMIKLRTSEFASKDLDKYSKALDTAIMRYHKMKMDEINKIIKDLWRVTYKGNDIDYIEIRSEDETSSATSMRKSYNYRVVMVKGDTDMDMRGRCSAGQKVLASLIIRLALAETFCLTCGILALDEPTTNLDRVNIEGLAHALVDIIKSRDKQRNFQLIVITHDEDFVELLGRSDYTDYFYRVTKNMQAKSVVTKHDIAALQTNI